MSKQQQFMKELEKADKDTLIKFANAYWNDRGIRNALFYFICEQWVEENKDDDADAKMCLAVINKVKQLK